MTRLECLAVVLIPRPKPASWLSRHVQNIKQRLNVRDHLAAAKASPQLGLGTSLYPLGLQPFPPYRFECEACLPRCTVGSRQAEHESPESRWKRTIW